MIDLIVTSSWGKAGELALGLGWRPQGRHFLTADGREGRIVSDADSFCFLTTPGSNLHLCFPLEEHALLQVRYIHDMKRGNLIVYQ